MTIREVDNDLDGRFQTLYAKYFRRVVRFYVVGFHLAEEDAEDLAQDAFIRFYEAMEEYRGEAEWAFFEIIARRVLYNRIRGRKTAKRGADTVSLDQLPATFQPQAPAGVSYEDREAARLFREKLRHAILGFSKGQRQCFLLWKDGFKYRQIAEILKITEDAVKSRLRDAKKLLRDRMGSDADAMVWPDTLPEDEQ